MWMLRIKTGHSLPHPRGLLTTAVLLHVELEEGRQSSLRKAFVVVTVDGRVCK